MSCCGHFKSLWHSHLGQSFLLAHAQCMEVWVWQHIHANQQHGDPLFQMMMSIMLEQCSDKPN